jgi:hypothetical protein
MSKVWYVELLGRSWTLYSSLLRLASSSKGTSHSRRDVASYSVLDDVRSWIDSKQDIEVIGPRGGHNLQCYCSNSGYGSARSDVEGVVFGQCEEGASGLN